MPDDLTQVKVDVGVLKSQTATLTTLCEKMDRVIEKIVSQQEKYISQVYDDMEKRRQEKNEELKEVNKRIDTVIDKVELTERRIMDEIRDLRQQITKSNEKEEQAIHKLNEWKWTIAGGIIVISWLISHVDFDTIAKLF
jgi:chromosome segregation ATPase